MDIASRRESLIIRSEIVARLVDVAERAILDDDWDMAIDTLASVLEIDPRNELAVAAMDHLTAPTGQGTIAAVEYDAAG